MFRVDWFFIPRHSILLWMNWKAQRNVFRLLRLLSLSRLQIFWTQSVHLQMKVWTWSSFIYSSNGCLERAALQPSDISLGFLRDSVVESPLAPWPCGPAARAAGRRRWQNSSTAYRRFAFTPLRPSRGSGIRVFSLQKYHFQLRGTLRVTVTLCDDSRLTGCCRVHSNKFIALISVQSPNFNGDWVWSINSNEHLSFELFETNTPQYSLVAEFKLNIKHEIKLKTIKNMLKKTLTWSNRSGSNRSPRWDLGQGLHRLLSVLRVGPDQARS